MGTVDIDDLPDGAVVILDSAPVIYYFEDHPTLAERFEPVFKAQVEGRLVCAIATTTVAEILVLPLRAGNKRLEARYRSVIQSWQVIPIDLEIAERAARVRASLGLRLVDAIQVASALAINADALITHDRDFSRVSALRVIT